MKTKELFGMLLLFLCAICFVSCDGDDGPQDKVETVKMFVSAETGMHQLWGAPEPTECMLVKEEKESDYKTLGFSDIFGFEYERGYEYVLLVKKTTLVHPLEDASSIRYELTEILSKKLQKLYETLP